MLHLLIALAGRSQLGRLRTDLLPVIEEGIAARLARGDAHAVGKAGGAVLAACGPDPRAAADLARDIRGFLAAHRDELFGFALVLHELADAPDAARAEHLAAEALDLDPPDGLWIAPAAAAAFDGLLASEARGAARLVLEAAHPGEGPAAPEVASAGSAAEAVAAPAGAAGGHAAGPWIREKLLGRCLEAFSRRLDDPDRRTVVFLHGRAGAGKRTLVAEAARRLGAPGPALRAYPLFRRRTTLHPFLNGVEAAFVASVPEYLAGAERGAWTDLAGVFSAIADPGSSPAVPDRAATDFVQAWRLYARARVRRAERACVPGVVVFEDVDAWHPAAHAIAASLIDDLLAEPAAVPVVTSTEGVLPPELSSLEIASLPVPPLGRREIRAFAGARYPGLELPEAVVRKLRGVTGGLPAAAAAALRSLAAAGCLRPDGGTFAWVQGRAADFTADPAAAAWALVRAWPRRTLALLLAVHLAGGLLDRRGLADFLAAEGYGPGEADRGLDTVVAGGLAVEEAFLVPVPPGLRRRLEEHLGVEAAALAGRFADHLVRRWEAGGARREVLLFTYLARADRGHDALRVLPRILRRKLDERDTAGARLFADPARLAFARPPAGADRHGLQVAATAARLRAAVLEERLEEAGGLVRDLARLARDGHAPVAESALASARYYLAVGDSASALDALKHGLAAAQDAGAAGAEGAREAALLLGATMLADGRLGEAGDYADMALREAREAGDRLGALRADSLAAACRFLEGRLDRAEETALAAAAAADELGQREEGLFLGFVVARIRFLLGDLAGCSERLQRCRCLARLYRVDAAEPVLDAWLARTLAYDGAPEAGAARLARLEPTREVLLFLAEAALFAGDPEAAAREVERGLAAAEATVFPPPHGGCWRDGFLALEGRCYSLARPGAFLGRQLAALRGHLLARRGFAAEAARELGALVHGGRSSDNDPCVHRYLHWYADALPEKGGDDDKLTVLAKALKGLQERGSRIGSPAPRSAFLHANRWHRAIMDDARARHLA
jgi:hypothetical protein